ncbi:tetratricopeptide repeat protein [Adhaeribacter aquaticus]|uniref:tetratricopeptide repeat protein n=1 Tax=Adhaeribacter aquaticus TaxID=299567 RepID=UPI000429299A|nr:tetratricopeptide repeat protein [Adhaeribacter aquaticus]
MAKNITKRESDLELLENPEVLADRLTHGSEDFVKKNKNVLLGLFAAVAAAIVGAFLFYNYRSGQEKDAQAAMYQAVYYFEADSLSKALKGDGQHDGLVAIADEYGSTKAGNLAKFYAGVSYLKQGKYQEALNYLEDYKSDDLILQGRAYALQGDANLELGKKAEAAELYMKAADYKANEFFSPQYLLKAGLAYEENNDYKSAVEAYNTIVEKYVNAPEVADAKKYKARAELLASGK